MSCTTSRNYSLYVRQYLRGALHSVTIVSHHHIASAGITKKATRLLSSRCGCLSSILLHTSRGVKEGLAERRVLAMARASGTGSTRDTYKSGRWLSPLLLLAFAGASANAAAPPTTVRIGYITPFSGAWSGGVQLHAGSNKNGCSQVVLLWCLVSAAIASKCVPHLYIQIV